MSQPRKTHFITAAALALVSMVVFQGAAHAQTPLNDVCAAALAPSTPNGLLTADTWFVAQEHQAAKTSLKSPLFNIMPADASTLWSSGSRVLSNLPAPINTTQSDDQSYFIVRAKAVHAPSHLNPLGQTLKIIGTAYLDERVKPAMSNAEPTSQVRALTITESTTEVTSSDRLLPKNCWRVDERPTEPVTNLLPSAPAKIIATLDDTAITSQAAFVLIDQGGKNGVARLQNWQLIDQLPNQPASAKTFGTAQIVQVFDDFSIARISHATHEARINTTLVFAP